MLGRLIKSLSAIMMEGQSLTKAAVDSISEPIQAWQKVTVPCISTDKRRVLKEAYTHNFTFLTSQIPQEKVKIVSKLLRPLLVDIRGRQFIQDPANDKMKLVVFDPVKVNRSEELLSEASKSTLKEEGISFPPTRNYTMKITYEMYNIEHALQNALPEHLQISGYSVIGHIAHLNLNEAALPYKYVIGQIILDKNPRLRTVVNKLQNIDNTFRNFQMELLAGEEDYLAELKENGCKFKMDFSKVYWNSRLSTEHQRIVDRLQSDDVLYDLFAGIGPFSIPAARKGCTVIANDLNPESFSWLRTNVTENESKRRTLWIQCHNLDARQFVREIVRSDYRRRVVDADTTGRLYAVMNLPGSAIEFLDVFRELVDAKFVDNELAGDWSRLYPLHVRCYCFLRDEIIPDKTHEEMTLSTVESEALKRLDLKAFSDFNVRFVRNVAVSKNMFCLEFSLTKENFAQFCEELKSGDEDPSSKRLKLSSDGN